VLLKIKRVIKNHIPKQLLITSLVKNSTDRVLLTFDDGPHPEVTDQVLVLLKKHNVKAVFFIPGRRIARAPYLLSRIIKDGHEIGNHSYIHSRDKQPLLIHYIKDLIKCQREIERYSGMKPKLFRPPKGIISPTTLLSSVIVGLRTITWSLDVRDWQCKSKNDAVTASWKLLQMVKAGDIILLHDDNPCVIDILEIILPELKKRGLNISDANVL